MEKEYNTEWAKKLMEMRPKWNDKEETIHDKTARIVDYVAKESNVAFIVDKRGEYLIQKKTLPWSCLFEVIKNAPEIGFIVSMALPPRFKMRDPKPARGTMFAYYNPDADAILLRVYTGARREDLAGYDGWGREPDELEVVEGLRDSAGNWIEPLALKWI